MGPGDAPNAASQPARRYQDPARNVIGRMGGVPSADEWNASQDASMADAAARQPKASPADMSDADLDSTLKATDPSYATASRHPNFNRAAAHAFARTKLRAGR